MKYRTEELEKMSKEDLIEIYRKSKINVKKDILKKLAKSEKFPILMNQLSPAELIDMAKIHPDKEAVIDTMIEEMEFHGTQMAKYFGRKSFQREIFNKFIEELQYKSPFSKIKETITKNTTLSEKWYKKIEYIKKLCEIEIRRTNATGKKMEQLESQDPSKAVDESRIEINNGEMAKLFDRCTKEIRKNGKWSELYEEKTEVANKVKTKLTEEYISILGTEKEDIARLVAMNEFENYCGQELYIPYFRNI